MLKLTAVCAVFLFMHYYIYKRISQGFDFSWRGKFFFKIFLALAGLLYITVQILHFVFSLRMHHIYIAYPLVYSGFLWIRAIPTLCVLCFLETGLSKVFPDFKNWWLRGIPIIFALRIFLLRRAFPYGKEIPNYSEISGKGMVIALYLIVSVILYKIIVVTINPSEKKKGSMIIIFSIGPLLAFFGLEIAVLSLIFGFYAIIFARVSAGLKLSNKNKQIVIGFLFIGIIISLPHMLWWGNALGIPFLHYIGGAWYGFIILASTLFLLESGVAFFSPSHPQQRVSLVLVILAAVSVYGIINALRVPAVKEIIIPMKKLPAQAQDFTIVQWSDIHLGNLVSPNWLRKTALATNNLKPDLIVITGDIIDNGFEKTFIETLKQLKTKYGIFAVTGNHEYYFNNLYTFHEVANEAGIRVLDNECINLPNGIQIAGINDSSAQEITNMRHSLSETLKNRDQQKPLILLCHHAEFFTESVRNGVDLQLSGHNHFGQLPPIDLFIYLTLKYSYGFFQEGNSYLYISCGTGLWSIPMRILHQGEITKIILKKE